jgi:membrane-bound lytic murein transglycosylase MltF
MLPLLAMTVMTGLIGTAFGQTNPSPQNPKVMALPTIRAWTGDFDGMLKRRAVRILIPHSRTLFFQDKGTVRGAAAEIALEFETWLNKRYGKKPYKIQVALIPTPRDRLFAELQQGRGDIIAASLTITPERSALADFARPWGTGVKEVLVTGPAAPDVASIADLGGKEVRVRKSSSYYEHLVAHNARVTRESGTPITIAAADENLEDEDLMEMVGAGILPWAIVDSHTAKIWASIFKGLTVREDIAVHEGGEIAWAFRKDSPGLKKELGEFVEAHAGKPVFSDILLRYYRSGKTIKNALSQQDADKLERLLVHFRTFGTRFSIDPFLLAAQGYQESGLDQRMRMRSGAVGIMQIKPSTAREKAIDIKDVAGSAENNIHAGSKYLRFLADKYINDPAVDDANRVLMALAAYNAGPGNLKRFRESAAKNGFNPNLWFGNVETGAAAIVGQETVQYVGNIYKYYVAYLVLLMDKQGGGNGPRVKATPPKH